MMTRLSASVITIPSGSTRVQQRKNDLPKDSTLKAKFGIASAMGGGGGADVGGREMLVDQEIKSSLGDDGVMRGERSEAEGGAP